MEVEMPDRLASSRSLPALLALTGVCLAIAGYVNVRAISAGAAGAVPRNAAPAVLRAAFEAVVGGSTLLPLEVVRALRSPPGESDVST